MSVKSGIFLIYLGLFYCAFIWGSTFVVTKWALSSVNPVTMVCIRFFISALLLIPFVYQKGFKIYLKEAFILSLFLSSLYITQTAGLLYTTASNSGFITGLFIIFIPIFSFLFKKRKITYVEFIASALAICGMWFLTGGIRGINSGDILTLVAAMSYSAHLLVTDEYVKKEYDITLLAFHQFWMVGLISLFFCIIADVDMRVKDLNGWIVIFFLAIFPTISAFFIQMKAQKIVEPFKVGIIFCFEPVFAAIFAWTLGGESFIWSKVYGGILIVSAMFINEFTKLKKIKNSLIGTFDSKINGSLL